MSIPEKQYNRQELLVALKKGWQQYLARLATHSEEEQARYAQAQGYARVEDVLAHIFAWWERSLQRSQVFLQGRSATDPEVEVLFTQTIDEFNADIVARYQSWDLLAIQERFTVILAELDQFLQALPDAALENELLQRWMRSEVIDHYEEHRLPEAPRL